MRPERPVRGMLLIEATSPSAGMVADPGFVDDDWDGSDGE
jgi:hypothetical protein